MTTMMDITFSSFLGGIITLIILNANMVIRETWSRFNSDYIVQQMLISNAQIVECEFRNMGCGLDTTQNSITEARDTCIQFRMTVRPEPNSPLVSIKYYTGSINELTTSENPEDRFLYRQQDSQTPQRVGIVTNFSLKYFTKSGDSIGTPITDPDIMGTVRIVELTMEVQSPFNYVTGLDGKKYFEKALWKQTRLASQNLNR